MLGEAAAAAHRTLSLESPLGAVTAPTLNTQRVTSAISAPFLHALIPVTIQTSAKSLSKAVSGATEARHQPSGRGPASALCWRPHLRSWHGLAPQGASTPASERTPASFLPSLAAQHTLQGDVRACFAVPHEGAGLACPVLTPHRRPRNPRTQRDLIHSAVRWQYHGMFQPGTWKMKCWGRYSGHAWCGLSGRGEELVWQRYSRGCGRLGEQGRCARRAQPWWMQGIRARPKDEHMA